MKNLSIHIPIEMDLNIEGILLSRVCGVCAIRDLNAVFRYFVGWRRKLERAGDVLPFQEGNLS